MACVMPMCSGSLDTDDVLVGDWKFEAKTGSVRAKMTNIKRPFSPSKTHCQPVQSCKEVKNLSALGAEETPLDLLGD